MVEQQTFVTPSGLFLIGITTMYITTALLHPREFHLLVYGFLYFVCIPSGYLLLAIYSMVNMNNVSWGTRESASQTGGPEEKMQKVVKCEKLLKICGYKFSFQMNKEEKVMCAVPENALQATALNAETKMPIQPKEEPFVEDFFIQQLAEASGELALREQRLNLEEAKFWKDLIEEYLKPLEIDKKKEQKAKADLQDLRNKATFVFFICNALWLVATFFLQIIGSSVSIQMPKVYANGTVDPNGKIYIDPIGLMFLLSFVFLFKVQFLAMLWHRIQTFIHFIAYIGTEDVVNRKLRKHTMSLITEVHEDNNFL